MKPPCRAEPSRSADSVTLTADRRVLVPASTLKSRWWNWVARQKIHPHLPIHGLRDSFGTWVYETYGVKQAQEWLGHSAPATTLRHYVRLTTAARAKAVAGLDEVTRAALERAEAKVLEDARPGPEQRLHAREPAPVAPRVAASHALSAQSCSRALAPATVTTTLPRTWPDSICRSAAGTSPSA